MSHILTTPSESLEVAMPFSTCRLMDRIGTEVGGVEFESLANGFVNGVLICQNLADRFWDAEMREEEENAREVISLVCPIKVSTRQVSGVVMSQT
jgi:hypothetical protein